MGRPFACNIHFGPVCHEWMSAKNRKGYGQFKENGKLHIATRYAYAMANGPIPDGMQVCHRCDNPKCVRLDHLFLGTNSDNQKDAVAKGRHASTKKTHCTKGHQYTEENTLRENDGSRRCRTCNKTRCAKYVRKPSNATNQSV